eukprot:350352-Chlamydomonas_euryale.AAC.1
MPRVVHLTADCQTGTGLGSARASQRGPELVWGQRGLWQGQRGPELVCGQRGLWQGQPGPELVWGQRGLWHALSLTPLTSVHRLRATPFAVLPKQLLRRYEAKHGVPARHLTEQLLQRGVNADDVTAVAVRFQGFARDCVHDEGWEQEKYGHVSTTPSRSESGLRAVSARSRTALRAPGSGGIYLGAVT